MEEAKTKAIAAAAEAAAIAKAAADAKAKADAQALADAQAIADANRAREEADAKALADAKAREEAERVILIFAIYLFDSIIFIVVHEFGSCLDSGCFKRTEPRIT